ncbi:hypothetical protein QBC36DRAFT_362045 [Triangularia setosa]|uniref:F-box domain-containing protein n=1 Tax=Triangularia setosa TaxID=2587417 RepID=A0AAN6WCW2_9PEZI|nr:hypothetical protein QBC36DRAFT_362045 [Podospora setosa]
MVTPNDTPEMTTPAITSPPGPPPTTPTLSTLSTLLPELLLHILESIPSTATLSNLLKACPPAWRVYVKHSQPLLLRLARYRYSKPDLTADDIISFRAPLQMPFMHLITQKNQMSFLTDSPGRLDHSRCERLYLLMKGEEGEETWVQLPRWGELVVRWDEGWEGRKERSGGRLTLKRVRYYGEMTRFLVGWERWMEQGREGEKRRGTRKEKVMERTTEMQCLEGHEEFSGSKGRRELEWVVTVQRRREFLPGWGGEGPQRLVRGNRVRQEGREKPAVKATVKREEKGKRKVKEETKSTGNKRVKLEEVVPAVQESVQQTGSGNGELRIKSDPEEEPILMPPPKPTSIPRFKLEEDDW